MLTLAQLAQQVADAVAQRRIGRPVALRMHAYLVSQPDQFLAVLAEVLELASNWFEGRLGRVDVRTPSAGGHATVLAEFTAGETALVSCHRLVEGTPRLDVLLIGSQGTLQLDGETNAGQMPLSGPGPRPEPDPLLACLQQSLEQQAPVRVR